MADFNLLVPLLLRFEASCIPAGAESLEQAFDRCRPQAYSNRAEDAGGPTFYGITLATYRRWCRRENPQATPPTATRLRQISFAQWRIIARTLCWQAIRGDLLCFNGTALMLADFYWHSGRHAIKVMQQLLNTRATTHPRPEYRKPLAEDGILGPKTYNALKRATALPHLNEEFIRQMAHARRLFLTGLAARRPTNAVFLDGWLQRVNTLEHHALSADPTD